MKDLLIGMAVMALLGGAIGIMMALAIPNHPVYGL